MEEIKPIVTELYEFESRDKSIIIEVFDFLDYRDFDARNKLNEFFIKSCSPRVASLFEKLMKNIKPVVSDKN